MRHAEFRELVTEYCWGLCRGDETLSRKQWRLTLILMIGLSGFSGCQSTSLTEGHHMEVTGAPVNQTADGKPIHLYTLHHPNGCKAEITNFGATLVSLEALDREGNIADVIVGYPLDRLIEDNDSFFGCVVGRYSNRIAKGKFSLDGRKYTLATNEKENHLHGGLKGFDKVVWDSESFEDQEGVGVKLEYLSPDGEEGYPGNVSVTVTYTFTKAGDLKIHYHGTTDQKTVLNLTNHSYVNAGGHWARNTLDHEITINADRYTPVDDSLIPTGELASVKGTPFDLRRAAPLGKNINRIDIHFDHNFVLNHGKNRKLILAASLYDPVTGRVVEIHTTQPGIQFYSGNHFKGEHIGKNGVKYYKHQGLALETQHYPDSPNQPNFPSTVLNPGEKYNETTIYKFSTR